MGFWAQLIPKLAIGGRAQVEKKKDLSRRRASWAAHKEVMHQWKSLMEEFGTIHLGVHNSGGGRTLS